jgi:hypothetical protein
MKRKLVEKKIQRAPAADSGRNLGTGSASISTCLTSPNIFISKPIVLNVDNFNTMEKGKERRMKGLRKNS